MTNKKNEDEDKDVRVESKPEEVETPRGIDFESRVDDHSVDMLKSLGYTKVLPDGLVRTINEFKLRKDRILPGRMTPEALAFCTLLYDMHQGRFNIEE